MADNCRITFDFRVCKTFALKTICGNATDGKRICRKRIQNWGHTCSASVYRALVRRLPWITRARVMRSPTNLLGHISLALTLTGCNYRYYSFTEIKHPHFLFICCGRTIIVFLPSFYCHLYTSFPRDCRRHTVVRYLLYDNSSDQLCDKPLPLWWHRDESLHKHDQETWDPNFQLNSSVPGKV